MCLKPLLLVDPRHMIAEKVPLPSNWDVRKRGINMGIARRLARNAYAHASLQTLSIRRAQRRLASVATRHRRFVICLPYLKSGGAEKVAANLAHAFSHLYGPDSVAVLVTDWSGLVVRLIFPENVFTSYPQGVSITNIVALNRAGYHERTWDLMTALMSMRPEMVINVNSRTMWECYERFAPELSAHMRLGAVAFAHVTDKAGKAIGYTATHLERLLPFLDFVITDNAHIIEELRRTYISAPRTGRVMTDAEWAAAKLLGLMDGMGGSGSYEVLRHLDWALARRLAKQMTATELEAHDVAKFHCLYQETTPAARLPAERVRPRRGRPQVMWASRVSRHKFPELLPHIARMAPECDIHAFGSREIGYRFPAVKNLLLPGYDLGDRLPKVSNLHWRGAYKKMADLPLGRFSAFVYTSIHDGLPNVLLEVGAHGVPIIAPTGIGGIGELISEETGWPIQNPYDAREYADRVREVVASPAEAARRAEALLELIDTRHNSEIFFRAVEAFVEGGPISERALRTLRNGKHANGAIAA
jgi:glycosyltransferase involved in cell wall biosynthesis